MTPSPLIVGIGGTTRAGSTSEQAFKIALARASALGCGTMLFPGPQLPTEIYDPTQLQRSAQAAALVAALRLADGVIIATPAYHGGLSGLVKHALDFTEGLRGDARVYLEGRAVGCIVCAEGAQAMGSTLASVRAIVQALRGWPTPFGATLNSAQKPFGSADQAADPATIQACHTGAQQLVDFARMQRKR